MEINSNYKKALILFKLTPTPIIIDYKIHTNLPIFIYITRWVKLNDLNFDIINWSVKDKFIDILH